MKARQNDPRVENSLQTTSGLLTKFLNHIGREEVPLVFAVELEAAELSFEVLFVHKSGQTLRRPDELRAYFEAHFEQLFHVADDVFQGKSNACLRLEIFEFEVYSEYDSTSPLDQRGKPVMAQELRFSLLR